jgi:hypothetical protein
MVICILRSALDSFGSCHWEESHLFVTVMSNMNLLLGECCDHVCGKATVITQTASVLIHQRHLVS